MQQLHPGATGQKGFQASSHRVAFGVDEFADAAGVGRTYVFAEIKSGRLRARKAGKRTLITYEDAIAWLTALPVVSGVA